MSETEIGAEGRIRELERRERGLQTLLESLEESMGIVGAELDTLREKVGQLEAEKAEREREAQEAAYFAVGDEHLLGNRLRWAGRVLRYWWNTRVGA